MDYRTHVRREWVKELQDDFIKMQFYKKVLTVIAYVGAFILGWIIKESLF